MGLAVGVTVAVILLLLIIIAFIVVLLLVCVRSVYLCVSEFVCL